MFLFDTEGLDLLKQGVIVRLRRGAESDLTVKLMSTKGEKSFPLSEASEGFKCEVGSGAGVFLLD